KRGRGVLVVRRGGGLPPTGLGAVAGRRRRSDLPAWHGDRGSRRAAVAKAQPPARPRARGGGVIWTMTREEIIAKIRSSAPAFRAEGGTKLAIFGSPLRTDARADSDLDLLIEVDPNAKFSLLDLIGVEHIIEDATGLRAQATMRRSLEPRMAKRIADDIIEVF